MISKDLRDVLEAFVIKNKSKDESGVYKIIKKDESLKKWLVEENVNDKELKNFIVETRKVYRIGKRLERIAKIAQPIGWTAESFKKWWDSVTGDYEHKFTKCMKVMEKHVDDPGAFCGYMAKEVGYKPQKKKK